MSLSPAKYVLPPQGCQYVQSWSTSVGFHGVRDSLYTLRQYDLLRSVLFYYGIFSERWEVLPVLPIRYACIGCLYFHRADAYVTVPRFNDRPRNGRACYCLHLALQWRTPFSSEYPQFLDLALLVSLLYSTRKERHRVCRDRKLINASRFAPLRLS